MTHRRQLPTGAVESLRMATPSLQQLVTTFHIGRSGSTVLGDLLNQHSQVQWLGEIHEWPEFRDRGAPPASHDNGGSELIRRLRTRLPDVHKPVAGVEAKFFHLHDHGVALDTFLDELRGQVAGTGRCRFIVLRRKNYLRKIVSSLAARQRGQWFANPGAALNPVQIEIHPERVCIDGDAQPLLDYLQDWDAQFAQLDAALAAEGALALSYEDDIAAGPLAAYESVCRYLELEPEVPEVRYARTTTQPLDDIVTTIGAVRAALAGTGYEWMAN